MNILVFGAGAIGSLLGGLLSREHDVTIVGRNPHVKVVQRRGLRITGLTSYLAWPAAATEVPAKRFDVAFVTTKAYDTKSAIDALRPLWSDALFVTVQNGLGNAERIAERAERVAAGTTSHGVTFAGPGEIVHAGRGDTLLGAVQGIEPEEVQPVADALSEVGISTDVVPDVRREIWAKAVVNAAINPLTAILRVPNGALVDADDLRALLERLAREGAASARAGGVDLDPDALAAKAVDVAKRTAENRSSMLQDVTRGRRTEIDSITGELLRVAELAELALPYNRFAYDLIRGIERSRVALV